MHTAFCGHASGTMEEYVLSAIGLGMMEMGFSDHFPYPEDFTDPVGGCVIPRGDFPSYLSNIRELQRRFHGRIAVRTGVEVDFLPDHLDAIGRALDAVRLDYVIGSVHWVNGTIIDYSEEKLKSALGELGGREGLWRQYWETLEKMVQWGACDAVGHFDLPKKFLSMRDYPMDMNAVDRILDLMARKGLVLDVNTSGKDRSRDGEIYPSPAILKHAARKGIEIMLGSDAHSPQQLGRYFSDTACLLRSLGWKHCVSFQHRIKRHHAL
ncbi:histidinol-phosphatase HisJ [bacterium]|nr:histidinol-phosphatase HisJ [bacterium]